MGLHWLCVCSALIRSNLELEVGIQFCNAMFRANSYRELRSLTLCSSINKFCFFKDCIKNDSQQFSLIPLLQGFISSMICSAFPFSCLFYNMYRAKSETGLFVFMHRVCSLSLISIDIQSVQYMIYCRCCFYISCMFFKSYSYLSNLP